MLKIKFALAALAFVVASTTLAHADVVLVQEDFSGAAGTSLNGVTPTIGLGTNFIANSAFSADGTADLSCLLYTSPSPRDQRGSRMPSSA